MNEDSREPAPPTPSPPQAPPPQPEAPPSSAEDGEGPPIPRRLLDDNALKVLHRLTRNGFEAYLVGGCVRDLLLRRQPKDFDIATGARPRQVKRLFRNSRVIGRRFRLVHVHFGPRVLEVATFRAPPQREDDDLYVTEDNEYGDAESDAKRRDFTINGLFYDAGAERVIDLVGGLPDLRSGLLRTIGDADERLPEDPIRILRAAKFVGRLGFSLTDDLERACRKHAGDLVRSAPARVLEEIYRLLSARGASNAFRMLHDIGALRVVLPELDLRDPERAERFFASLDRLEMRTEGMREGATQSLMLATLVFPIVREALLDTSHHDHEAQVLELLDPVLRRYTVARRDVTRARQCLAAQVRLATEPQGRPAQRFAHRDFFREAVELRRILGPLAEEGEPDPIVRWQELAHLADRGELEPARGRRRRRGGRRRNRAGNDGAPPAAGTGAAKEEPSCNEPSKPSGSSSAPSRRRRRRRSRRRSSRGGSSPA